MKVFVVLSAVVACAMSQVALPYGLSPFGISPYGAHPYNAYPYGALPYAAPVAVAAPVVLPTSSQYRAQDELGQFTFGTAGDNQARVETKTLDGTVTGAYSYVDPNGKVINVNYLADHNGFRVLGANNLPEAPAPIADPMLKGPEPVQDTPEVMAARAEFEKKFAEAKMASASRKKRQVILSAIAAPTLAKSTLKYSSFEPVEAKVPADTKKIELKEKETEILTPVVSPLTYSAVLPTTYGAFPYGAIPYGLPALRSPIVYSL